MQSNSHSLQVWMFTVSTGKLQQWSDLPAAMTSKGFLLKVSFMSLSTYCFPAINIIIIITSELQCWFIIGLRVQVCVCVRALFSHWFSIYAHITTKQFHLKRLCVTFCHQCLQISAVWFEFWFSQVNLSPVGYALVVAAAWLMRGRNYHLWGPSSFIDNTIYLIFYGQRRGHCIFNRTHVASAITWS